MPEWFYVQNGEQAGPVDASRLMELLASGAVKRDDLVWREGMANWAEAHVVAELRVAPIQAQVPLLAATPSVPAPTFKPGPATASAPIPVAQYYSPQSADALLPSRLGTASFIIGIIAVVLELACLIYVGVHASAATGAGAGGKSASAGTITAGLGLIAGALFCLLGLGLGIAALLQKRKRPFAIAGVVINGGILLLFIAIMVIGMLA
jgi:hypothetical protein